MILKNKKTGMYHPIVYFESLLPGGPESEDNKKLIRYKSKAHHTAGFSRRIMAINYINEELIDYAKKSGHTNIKIETSDSIVWDGEDIPEDVQLRKRVKKEQLT